MVHIHTTSHLESFRHFLINSTCLSFIPERYLRDPAVFPEKEGEVGSIYVEAAFIEPVASCIRSVNKWDIAAGDDVMVIGTGPVGPA